MTVRFLQIRKAEHGGRREAEGQHNEGRVLDYSASLNPIPPVLTHNISSEAMRRYPDDYYSTLKEVIARHHHRSPEEICVGNGSVEVIRTLCHTILKPGNTAYVPLHTFSEYALSACLAGAEISGDPEAHADISFLCNPDNPSGILSTRNEVVRRLEQVTTAGGGILCVDEAFIDLADPTESVSDIRDSHLFVLRSLTKSFSMAGVRFGYGIGEPELIEAMEVMRPPWTVNAFAEAMAIQAFSRYQDLEKSRQYIRDERDRVSRRCTELGLIPSQSSANYLLLDVGMSGTDLTAAMRRHRIIIRDCTSFGLPSCVRVAIQKKEENDLLLEALAHCLH